MARFSGLINEALASRSLQLPRARYQTV